MNGPRPPRFGGKQLLKAGLFVTGSVLVAGVFVFTHMMVQRLSEEVATTSGVLARFNAEASVLATRDPEVRRIFSEVVESLDFPIIITDTTGVPRAWQDVGVPHRMVGEAVLDSLSAGVPVSAPMTKLIHGVRSRVTELDRRHKPIAVWQTRPDSVLIGFVHYGEPAVMSRLRWMPFMAVGGTGLLLLLGLSGLASIRQAEKRTIWVGMAKETAHQLGTPLSSLMGWVELLRGHAETAAQGEVRIPVPELVETLDDMDRDIERLSKVAQRFSHIGSAPQLQLQDVAPVVREAVQYVRRRIPQSQGVIEIRERYDEVPPINLNRELLEWAVENLISNALSALDKKPGVIEVSLERRAQTEEVEILVTDNGRGMSREEQAKVFEPGYTTKRRGWGLGLALARRVVEEYHAGRIGIRHSSPGEGTTMVIRFPT
ncbi:MAG: HAMP domain-containing sensor histidine kinase [Candidatus Eisenbacteria bacterium]